MSESDPLPQQLSLQIALPEFEGPLDLLLHLIRKHELDILDLPVAFITERYLEYLDLMNDLNLNVASEYLVMAATLAYIKSRTLLPDYNDHADEDDEEDAVDPREELIRRLLEYQKYKEVAQHLNESPIQGRDVFLRGSEAPVPDGPADLAEIGLFRLLDAFEAILKKHKRELVHEVSPERISIQQRITELTDTLRAKGSCRFEELLEPSTSVYDLVVTFLAILEMAKKRLLRIAQHEYTAPITLELRVIELPPGQPGEDLAETLPEPNESSSGAEHPQVHADRATTDQATTDQANADQETI